MGGDDDSLPWVAAEERKELQVSSSDVICRFLYNVALIELRTCMLYRQTVVR